jgi:hypothetical protein
MWAGGPLADGGSRDCTSGMDQGLELISVTRVKQYDGCGIEVVFSDGTVARYAAEELAALRPYREPMRPELFH